MKRLGIFVCLAALASGCTAPGGTGRFAASSVEEPAIRVLLADGGTSYRVGSSGGLTVQSADGLEIVGSSGRGAAVFGALGESIQIEMEPDGALGAVEGEALIVADSKSVLMYDGIAYAGKMRVVPSGGGKMMLINILPIERYLEGVLPHEIGNPGTEGYNAVKVQAVAARTYALGKMESHKGDVFDVHASVMDQVYRGLKGATKVASGAVRDTRGRVMDYKGNMVKAYYSACCGGHTSDIRQVWPDREAAGYLHGVPDRAAGDDRAFCRAYKRFRWRYGFTGKELGNILRITLPKQLGVSEEEVGAVKDIRIDERSHSGRVTKLTIETTLETFVVEGDRIRWILEPDPKRGRILPSVMFRLDKVMERDRIAYVSISGGGNGHGVGMCQHGAIGMAKKGYTYEMILTHYYPGCTIEKAY